MAIPAPDPPEARRPLPTAASADMRSRVDPSAPTAAPPARGPHPLCETEDPESFLAPQQLGPYKIIRPLGKGGMGAVYEALDTERQLRVALKTLRPEVHASLAGIWNEFHTLAELRHENLVRIYDLMTEGPITFYTMELVEGVDFRTWVMPTDDVTNLDALDVPRLKNVLRQLVEALDYMHRAGQLHRDLKPSNVLVTHAGKVKVVDFGLAAPIDRGGWYENSAPGQPVGTWAYMAPEQAAGEDLTSAADWYSVGVMLYECLMSTLPFPLKSPFELQEHKKRGVVIDSPRWSGTALGGVCEALLHPDARRRPTSDELLARIGGAPLVAEVPVPATRLIGRERHLAVLRESYGVVEHEQQACAVLVRGRSGMGKSELIRRFLDEVRDARRADIFRGRCYDSVFAPYKAFEPIIALLARRLQRMDAATLRAVTPLDVGALCEVFPVLAEAFPHRTSGPRKASVQEKRHRAFSALRELLARLGPRGPLPGSRPLVLFIDDLQWGDVDSAMLLADLLRAPAPPLLFLGALRSEDEATSPCLAALLNPETFAPENTDASTVTLDVEPLAPGETAAMVSQLLNRSPQDAVCRRVAREANGSPLFIQELARSVRRLHRDDQQVATGVRLESVLWQRIESLNEEERRLLLVVAAAERPIERHVAFQAAGFQQHDPAVCDGMIDDRLLRTMGSTRRGHFDTYHDRIRETILAHVPLANRTSVHRAIADALQSTGGTDDEFIGQQLFAGGDVPAACLRFRRAAARAAQTLAFDRAARLYRIVVDHEEKAESDVALRRELAMALANTGRCAEAAEQYLIGATHADDDEATTLRCEAALRYLTSGHLREGLQALGSALANVGMRMPRTRLGAMGAVIYWRACLALRGVRSQRRNRTQMPARKLRRLDVCWSAVAGLSLVDPLRAAVFVARNVALARDGDEPKRLLRALAAYTGHVAIGGSRSRRATARVCNQLNTVAAEVEGRYPRAIVNLSRSIVAHLNGRWEDAWHAADEAELLFTTGEERDVAWELDTARTFALWARMYAGRWHELSQRQPGLRREAIERDDLFARLNFGARMATCVLLAGDRPQEAQRLVEDDQKVALPGAFHVQHHNLLLARVLIELYEGRAQRAWEIVAEGWTHYRRSLLGTVQQVRVDFFHMQGTAAIAAAAASSSADARNVVRRIVRRLQREPVAWAQAIAQFMEAQRLLLSGERDAAAPALARAVEELESAQMRLLSAAARWRLAEVTGEGQHHDLALKRFADESIARPERVVQLFVPAK